MKTKKQLSITIVGIIVAIFVATLVSICVGKYEIKPSEVVNLLTGEQGVDQTTKSVFFTIRLPRTLMAIISGCALGIAGSIYQMIFKNPLASPDIIGIAGGANLGAAIAIVLFSSAEFFSVAFGAFWGGLLAVFCVMLLVRATGSKSTSTYILAGIVINAVSKACIMALKYFADPENELAAMEYWEMGTFGNVTATKVAGILPLFIVAILGLIALRRQIELMSLGDDECRALGVRLKPIRASVLVLSTLLVASAVSITGLVSFAGLIAPHVARLLTQRCNSSTIFISGIVGSFIVLCADILARSIYSAELPISILTTVIGVPLLIHFLVKRPSL